MPLFADHHILRYVPPYCTLAYHNSLIGGKFLTPLPDLLLLRLLPIRYAQSLKRLLSCTLLVDAPLLFISYRTPSVSDPHDLANTPPFSLSPPLLTHSLLPILNGQNNRYTFNLQNE